VAVVPLGFLLTGLAAWPAGVLVTFVVGTENHSLTYILQYAQSEVIS